MPANGKGTRLILRLVDNRMSLGDKKDYPPVGAKLTAAFEDGEPVVYVLTLLGTDKEPRGVSLLATATEGPEEGMTLGKKFVVRFPDIGPFFDLDPEHWDAATKAYNRQFEEEIDSEIELLAHLSDDETKPAALILPEKHPQRCVLKVTTDELGDCDFPVALREYTEGASLIAHCCKLSSSDIDHFSGISARHWFKLAEQLIELVHRVHLAGAPHGYICPSNVIVAPESEASSRRKLSLINFERDLPDPSLHLTPKCREWGQRSTLSWRRRYDSPERASYYHDRTRMPETHDPLVPGDLYSLGLTLLWMATGKLVTPFRNEKPWRELPWNIVENRLLKSDRAIKQEIRAHCFDRLPAWEKDYESKMAAIEIVFACLRLEEHRFYNARAILEEFRQCRPLIATRTPPSDEVERMSRGLREAIGKKEKIGGTLVENLYRARLDRALLPFGEPDEVYQRFTVGTRAEIIDALVVIFREMGGKGYNCCRAVTTSGFFSDENCTSRGRVFSSIQRALMRGASIEWLFVLNEARMNDPSVIEVLVSQREGLTDGPAVLKTAMSKIRWLPMRPSIYKTFLREYGSFLYCYSEEEALHPVLIVPDYAAEPGRMIALRVFPVPQVSSHLRKRADALIEWFKDNQYEGYLLEHFPHRRFVA